MAVSDKQTVAFQIKKQTLKELVEIGQAVAATFEDFEFVIEAFDKTTGAEVNEIIGNLLPGTL